MNNVNSQIQGTNLINDVAKAQKLMEIEGKTQENSVEEFVAEVLSTLNNKNRSNSVKKIKGIIKKSFNCEKNNEDNIYVLQGNRSQNRSQNRVHFSEKNVTIEIPRPSLTNFQIVKEIFCFYCCFGYLFPNI